VGQVGERNNNVGVIMNEAMVEVGKSEERLDVLDFAGFWPVLNSLDLLQRHGEALQREAVAQVFHRSRVELALFRFSEKAISSESE